MRTTLTIDDDIAAALERLRRDRETSFKDLVNEALRRGVGEMTSRPKRRKPVRTRSVDLGTPLIPNIDNVAEILAVAEGDAYK
jgi:hypothetical protein